METAAVLLVVGIAYLAGSISSAILVARVLGLPDPRSGGSGNPGATNMLRLGGKKAAATTLIGDMLKGVLPALLGHAAGLGPVALVTVALAAVLGHLYPVFFGFRGGKGVATGVGALLAASWPIGVAIAGTWLAVFGLTRISSLAALAGFILGPLYAWWLVGEPAVVGVVALISALLIWRHRSNIRNLLDGTEGAFRSAGPPDEE